MVDGREATVEDLPVSLRLHHYKYAEDFPDLPDALAYARATRDLLADPPSRTWTRLNDGGVVMRYQRDQNILAVMDLDGTPRTMFRPDDPDPWEWFQHHDDPEWVGAPPVTDPHCRVCGFRWFGALRVDGRFPSYEICPCCATEAGHEDTSVSSSQRQRRAWLAAGAPYFMEIGVDDGLTTEERLTHVPEAFR